MVITHTSYVPLTCRSVFRDWNPQDKGIMSQSKTPSILSLTEAMEIVNRERFTLKEMQHHIPIGVDPDKIEAWLSKEDFRTLIGYSERELATMKPESQYLARRQGIAMLSRMKLA